MSCVVPPGATSRRTRPAAALLAALLLADAAPAVPPKLLAPASGHPAVGVWRTEYRDGCVETYYLHGDGSAVHTSGGAVSRGVFSVSSSPAANGAYVLVERPAESNGRPDCGGAVTTVGQASTLYVFFDAGRQQMLGCYDAAGRQCFGPLLRMDGPAT